MWIQYTCVANYTARKFVRRSVSKWKPFAIFVVANYGWFVGKCCLDKMYLWQQIGHERIIHSNTDNLNE